MDSFFDRSLFDLQVQSHAAAHSALLQRGKRSPLKSRENQSIQRRRDSGVLPLPFFVGGSIERGVVSRTESRRR